MLKKEVPPFFQGDSFSKKNGILKLAQKLEDPDLVQATLHDLSHENPYPAVPRSREWQDPTLGSGYAGVILLFSTLEQIGWLKSSQEAVVHRYVIKIKEAIETTGIDSLSLYSGITGICHALDVASMGGIRYQNILKTLHQYLIQNIDQYYLASIRNDLVNNQVSSSSHMDVISGLSGIGRYVIEHLNAPAFEAIAKKILLLLIERVQPMKKDAKIFHGFGLSPRDPIYFMSQTPPINITYNTGLAHGFTGILALLSIALLKGFEVPGQIEAIELLCNYLKSQAIIIHGQIAWPNSIRSEGNIEDVSHRPAWCYGSLGISRTLFLAGKALKNKTIKAFALDAFRQIFLLDASEWKLLAPTLCHGVAGLLLITHEMSCEEGMKDLSLHLPAIENRLFSFYNADYPLGFKDLEMSKSGKLMAVTNPGFLEGTSGILLTLIRRESQSDQWLLPLLIS